MKKFDYKAKSLDGKNLTGVVEATNKNKAAQILRGKNLIPFYLKEQGGNPFGSLLSSFQRISARDIADFTRQLSTMIEAGLALTDSLVILREQSKKPRLTKIIDDLVREIEGGSSFHDALARHSDVFSKIYLSLVKSGEASGSLDNVLKRMADSLERQEEFRSKVKGAMIYPVIIILGMIIVIFIMMIYVIPKLTSMYQEFDTTLPLPTQILIFMSNFMRHFWFVFLAIVAVAVYLIRRWYKTEEGRMKIDEFILGLPLIGKLVTKLVLTEVSRTFAMLLAAGVAIIDALNIVAEAANNAVFEQSIKKAAKEVEKGASLTAVFGRYQEYPPIFNEMVSVGEETGKLDEILERLAKQFEMESETALKALTTAIEPLMMIILGVGVGFIVISIITPIYNLTSQF